MGALLYIINQGRIYRGFRKDFSDHNLIELFSLILRDIPESVSLNALKARLRLRWEEPFDVIIPYGDGDTRNAVVGTVWTFNLDDDQLVFNKDGGQNGRLALSVLRQRSFTFDDFESYESSCITNCAPLTTFAGPYWQPVLYVPQRKAAFARRVLEDFKFQWRHILRQDYNGLTFRKMAEAILRIATFNFGIKEFTEPRQRLGGAFIGPFSLPQWRPLRERIVLIGRVWFVASQDPTEGLSSVREHQAAQQVSSSKVYLVMSVRHIILCRFIKDKLEWTRPEPFFNGNDPVSERAAEILLAAMAPLDPPLKTPIHCLPIELQTRIVRCVSQGPVEAARVGCILGLGLPFAWKEGEADVILKTDHRNRNSETPVQSQMFFGDYFGGVAYKGDTNSIMKTLMTSR